MASPAQITANQLNAEHSTGPKTEKGKAAVSANAHKHGLAAAFTVLVNEDQDEFDQLLNEFHAEFQPVGVHQEFLVNQMVKAQWQLARAQRLELVSLDVLSMADAPDDPDYAIANGIVLAGRDPITIFQRYAAQAERSYYKAHREFAAARKIQSEANLVATLDAGLVRRIVNAPLPNSPSYGSASGQPAKPPAQNKPNPPSPAIPAAPATAAKPSLRSQMPENLALCL